MLRKLGLSPPKIVTRDHISAKALPGVGSFEYSPLHDVDEIRLLSLAPRNKIGRHNGLNDAIQHVRLSASPLYTAVSWMWGRPGDEVDIRIGQDTLIIQRNLSRIIEYLRDDRQTRKVWIDAICIDQKNLGERNHQVQLMGSIYNNANYVAACLTTERARDREKLQNEAKSLQKHLEEDKRTTETSNYRHFLGNRYFTRRWIIQEIAQAKAVIFCCEGYLVPMTLLSVGFKTSKLRIQREVTEDRLSSSQADRTIEGRAAEIRAAELCCMEPSAIGGKPVTIEELLYLHEAAECSDFRDKIYALLSLTSQAQLHLAVQYDINRIQLMLSVLQICHRYEGLSMFRTLSLLCFLQQHLEVGNDDLRNVVLSSITPAPIIPDTFAIRGTVRGKIETLETGYKVDTAAVRMRRKLPSLFSRPGVSLKPRQMLVFNSSLASTIFEIVPRTLADINLCRGVEVSGIDQHLFAFRGNKRKDSSQSSSESHSHSNFIDYVPSSGPEVSEEQVFAGFATSKVAIGDEIWQFDRTPVAIIARETYHGYSLVGRAFLLRHLGANKQGCSPKRFEDELVWVKDSTKHRQLTPIVNIDIRGLYELMTWVNFDP